MATAEYGTTAKAYEAPATEYTTTAKWFHWVTVVLMAVTMPFGFAIKYIGDAAKMSFYAIHESTGVLLFFVVLARIVWRLRNPPPPHPADMPKPMQMAAATVHFAFYAALLVQPVLGFFMTNAWGFPMRGELAFLGFIDQPVFMEANIPLAEALKAVHTALAWTIVGLLALHIAAVVYHQSVRKDGTLLRMV